MTYKCIECGHIFEEGEQARWTEKHGLKVPPYETQSGCPLCKGSYEETYQCDLCRAHYLSEELMGGVCMECIKERWGDLDMCLKVGENDTTSVKLNCFLASAFDKEEIEMILSDALKSKQKYSSESVGAICESFAKDDIHWFGEMLTKEVKKSEDSKK